MLIENFAFGRAFIWSRTGRLFSSGWKAGSFSSRHNSKSGGKTRNRTGDTLIFSQLLYQLSYLAVT